MIATVAALVAGFAGVILGFPSKVSWLAWTGFEGRRQCSTIIIVVRGCAWDQIYGVGALFFFLNDQSHSGE